MAVCGDRKVRLWELGDSGPGNLLREYDGPSGNRAADLSPSGKWLAIGDADGQISVHSSDDAHDQLSWKAHDDEVSWLGFVDDGAIVSVGSGDGAVRLWTLDGGSLLRELVADEAPAALAIDPTGQLLALALPKWDWSPIAIAAVNRVDSTKTATTIQRIVT